MLRGFPRGSNSKESACNAGDWVRLLGWEDLLEKQPTPVFLPGQSHGQRRPVGYSPWDRRESGTNERLTSYTLFSPPLK